MNLFYLISAICFILGLKRLSHPKTARSGNFLAALGMLIAIAATLASSSVLDLKLIAIGVGIGSVIGLLFATRVQMTEMPQMVAIFNGLGGAASAFVASSEFFKVNDLGFIFCISVFIGTLTFSGSFTDEILMLVPISVPARSTIISSGIFSAGHLIQLFF